MMAGQSPSNTATRNAADLTLVKRAEKISQLNWEAITTQATAIRSDSVESRDNLLEQFITNAETNGHRIIKATDATAACNAVKSIIEGHKMMLIKSKSMVTEEIGLRQALEAAGWTVYETDLGEWIVQIRGELPSHITAPAIHLSMPEIASSLRNELKKDIPEEPEALTAAANRYLRHPLTEATAGVTGANFLIAETGEIVIIENEGNAFFSSSATEHVVVTGIDKVVRRRVDLAPLLKALTISATGQPQTVYTHIIGKRQEDDAKRTIVLLDNGRSELRESTYAEAARCIRCGACMNTCPVFRQTSGHGYGTVYPGPIGLIMAPFLEKERVDPNSAYFCTLCGACSDICPVKIPLAELIQQRRNELWQTQQTAPDIRRSIRLWRWAQSNRLFGPLLQRLLLWGMTNRRLRRRLSVPAPGERNR